MFSVTNLRSTFVFVLRLQLKCCSCHQGKGKDSSPCFIIHAARFDGIVAFLAVLGLVHVMYN